MCGIWVGIGQSVDDRNPIRHFLHHRHPAAAGGSAVPSQAQRNRSKELSITLSMLHSNNSCKGALHSQSPVKKQCNLQFAAYCIRVDAEIVESIHKRLVQIQIPALLAEYTETVCLLRLYKAAEQTCSSTSSEKCNTNEAKMIRSKCT